MVEKKIEIMMLVEKLNVALQTKGCKPIVPTKIKMLKKEILMYVTVTMLLSASYG